MIDRIKQVLDYSQLSSAAFADNIGISRSGLNHLLSGRNQPSLDVARKILAKYPEISTEWLIMGMGEMFRLEEDPSQVAIPDAPENTHEAYPAENPKIGSQVDLFGEYAALGDSEGDMHTQQSQEELSELMEQTDNEEDEQEDDMPVVAQAPVVPPVVSVKTQAAPVRPRKPSSEDRPSPAPARRERHAPTVPPVKKIQKIIFFYDDHSFEIYTQN